MYGTSLQTLTDLVAQGLTDTTGGSGVNLDGVQKWLIGALVGVIGVIALWRIFKTYAKDGGGDGADVKPEDHGKKQINNLANAGLTIGVLAICGVVIAWFASMVIGAVS